MIAVNFEQKMHPWNQQAQIFTRNYFKNQFKKRRRSRVSVKILEYVIPPPAASLKSPRLTHYPTANTLSNGVQLEFGDQKTNQIYPL